MSLTNEELTVLMYQMQGLASTPQDQVVEGTIEIEYDGGVSIEHEVSDLAQSSIKALQELKAERDELVAECGAWSALAHTLANKYPVDSQTFDYMDEVRATYASSPSEGIHQRDARMKAEALEEMLAQTIWLRTSTAFGYASGMAAEYRKQAEDKS